MVYKLEYTFAERSVHHRFWVGFVVVAVVLIVAFKVLIVFFNVLNILSSIIFLYKHFLLLQVQLQSDKNVS